MPYKNAKTKRAYHRDYMQRWRAAAKPDTLPVLNPDQGQADPPRRIDLNRPSTVESRYPWPAYLVQDGYWFDPDTGDLVRKVR